MIENLHHWHRRCRRYRYGWSRLSRGEKLLVLTLLCGLLYGVFLSRDSARDMISTQGQRTDVTLTNTDPAANFDGFYNMSLLGISAKIMKSPDDVIQDGSSRMRHRHEKFNSFCSTRPHDNTHYFGKSGIPLYRTNSLVSKGRQLLYCPVGKMASTFVTRFLIAALETDPVISPYVISPEKALRMRVKRTGKYILFTPLSGLIQTGWQETSFVNHLTRVLFVRCPFQRLWSAYLDKLLFPNPHYWDLWGFPAINRSISPSAPRNNSRQKTSVNTFSECGQSVTFSQFIQFVLSDLHLRDTHVRPVEWECSPCYVNYNVIGHVDTLISDVMYLANLLHVNNSTLERVNWVEEHAKDAIKDGVSNVFHKWSSRISGCMSMEEASSRLWRVFQLRGIISQREKYPFKQEDLCHLDARMMLQALFEARAKSIKNTGALEQQKTLAFLSAYQTVSAKLKDKIRNVYMAEFKMFGFDFLPNL